MPEDANIKDVNWSSSNEDVATVDGNGKVKGVAEGSATITATTVESDVNAARCVIFNSDGELSITDEKRSTAHCIRLVCDINN